MHTPQTIPEITEENRAYYTYREDLRIQLYAQDFEMAGTDAMRDRLVREILIAHSNNCLSQELKDRMFDSYFYHILNYLMA